MIEPGAAAQPTRTGWVPAAIFVAVALAGVWYAKWDPYYLKTLAVAASHSLGPSIVTGTAGAAPAPSWQAAWQYGFAYFKDIWVALAVGLLVGSGVQALLPPDWLRRVLGRPGAASPLVAAACALPSMMCTCCSAPVAVGLHRAQAAPSAVLAYWLANPVLNPATIVFMGFVLGWGWAVLRIVVGIALVALGAFIGGRLAPGQAMPKAALEASIRGGGDLRADGPFRTWARALLRLALSLLPEYVVVVFALGAARAWLFPAITPATGDGILLIIGLALAGTLFVIPTAGEVPIVQTLTSYGLGAGAAGALMITLPAVSLPSLVMLARTLPLRALAAVSLLVVAMGLVTALCAIVLHL